MRENYVYRYKSRNKFIFVPTPECNRRAEVIINAASEMEFPDYFFHYRSGGHVAALHQHRQNKFFFRIDLQNFFYSISRNRVSKLLRQCNFSLNARSCAEWSSVKNPHDGGPAHVLPIGFKQSPLLASIALWRSAVASAIEYSQQNGCFISVYFDDFIGSSNNEKKLTIAYKGILEACVQANLVANSAKLAEPADAITAFNCDLTHGKAVVTAARVQKFFEQKPSPKATASFEAYRERVQKYNDAS